MPNSTQIIKKAKYKFFVLSIVGFIAVLFVSLAGLRFHSMILDRQESIITVQENLFAQGFLIDKMSLLSKQVIFDEDKESQERMRLLVGKIRKKRKDLGEFFEKVKNYEVHEIEETIEEENLFVMLDDYIHRVTSVVSKDIPTGHGLALLNMSQDSLDEIQNTFKFINRKINRIQSKSYEQLKRMGIIIIAISLLQIILVWFLVFRPLYLTIFIQHEKINNALMETQRANRSRAEFLANISHEIRTPMTAILGYAEVLKDENVPRKQLEGSVGIINKNAEHLLSLIDEILDISKIESGKFELEKEEVDFPELLNEVCSLMKLKAESKDIQLEFQNIGVIPRYILSDKKRIKQILFNLIGNAIKFTEEGFVRLSLSYDKENESLNFTLKDTGCGIPDEKVESLFRPFEQADSSASRRHQGSGLGLVLSRDLARAMGGNVYIKETKLKEGTTFVFFFKAEVSKADFVKDVLSYKDTSEEEVEEKERCLEGKNILVVDDAKENARLFKIYLTQTKADIQIANNGLEAIEKVKENNFDMIFLDLQMPELDGYQAIVKMREMGFNKPIVALTAHAMKDEKLKTKEYGFDFHVSKPVSSEYLIEVAYAMINEKPVPELS